MALHASPPHHVLSMASHFSSPTMALPSAVSSTSFPPFRFPFFPTPLSLSSSDPSTTTIPHPASNASITTFFACVITHTSSLSSPPVVALVFVSVALAVTAGHTCDDMRQATV
ncbi:unnamed protein product [Closterium sp. NIES-53]